MGRIVAEIVVLESHRGVQSATGPVLQQVSQLDQNRPALSHQRKWLHRRPHTFRRLRFQTTRLVLEKDGYYLQFKKNNSLHRSKLVRFGIKCTCYNLPGFFYNNIQITLRF